MVFIGKKRYDQKTMRFYVSLQRALEIPKSYCMQRIGTRFLGLTLSLTIAFNGLGLHPQVAMNGLSACPLSNLTIITDQALSVTGMTSRSLNRLLHNGRDIGAKILMTGVMFLLPPIRDSSRAFFIAALGLTVILTAIVAWRRLRTLSFRELYFRSSEALAFALNLNRNANLGTFFAKSSGVMLLLVIALSLVKNSLVYLFGIPFAMFIANLLIRDLTEAYYHRFWWNTWIPEGTHKPTHLGGIHVLIKLLRSNDLNEWQFINSGELRSPFPGIGIFQAALFWIKKSGFLIGKALLNIALVPLGLRAGIRSRPRSMRFESGEILRRKLLSVAKSVVQFENSLAGNLSSNPDPLYESLNMLERVLADVGSRPLPLSVLNPKALSFLERLSFTPWSRTRLKAIFPMIYLDTNEPETILRQLIISTMDDENASPDILNARLTQYSVLLGQRLVALHSHSAHEDFQSALLASNLKFISSGERTLLHLLFSSELRTQFRQAA